MVAISYRRGFRSPLIAAALGALAALTLGCVGDPGSQVNFDKTPRFGFDADLGLGVDFRPVSTVLERRCGNLDCHGSQYRAMKIYGKYGLRRLELDKEGFKMTTGMEYDSYYSGGTETTIAELSDNYDSVISLEPVLLQEVFGRKTKAEVAATVDGIPCPYSSSSKTMDVECLTLIRKPRLQEKHKGGKIWERGAKGDNCLTLWILNNAGYADECATDIANFNGGN